MIQRAKSYSKGGINIERVMEIEKYKIDQAKLTRILTSKSQKLVEFKQKIKTPAIIEGFNKIPGREKPNSFLMHKVKDSYASLEYENKKDNVLMKTFTLPFRKENDERLSHLFGPKKTNQNEEGIFLCRKASECITCQNDHIQTARDLQSARKSYHSLNFKKQTSRPFDQSLLKLQASIENQLLMTRSNSMGSVQKNQQSDVKATQLKLNRAHSFASYTDRDFLTQKKLKCAPSVSGIDAYKINPQKFKGHWKVVNPPKFQNMARKHLNRHDRDCPPWFAKLTYNVKDVKKTVIKNHLDFNKQTIRQQNLVQSNYPIRLAI